MNLMNHHLTKENENSENMKVMKRSVRKTTKKTMAMAVTFAMTVGLLAGCSGSSSSSEEDSTRAQVEKPEYQAKLDLIDPTAYNNVYGLDLEKGTYLSIIGKRSDGAYWKEIQKGVKQAVEDINEELGYEGSDKVKATFNAPATSNDVDDQVNILDEELSRYPEALAISVADIKACEVQFDLATENDIPIVVYDSGTTYEGVMASVSTDNKETGKIVADKMGDAIEKTGEVLIFAHDSKSQAALDRTAAFTEEIQAAYPEVSIVETYAMDELDTYKQQVADDVNAGKYDLESKEYTGDGSSSETTDGSSTDNSADSAQASGNTSGTGQTSEASQGTADQSSSTTNDTAQTTDSQTSDSTSADSDAATSSADESKVQSSDITEENVVDYILAKHPDAKGIFATNSEAMSLVLSGLERNEADTDNLTIMGYDVNDDIKTAIEDGTIDGVILQNPFGMGYATVIATARAALDMANEAVVDTGYTWVTQDNYEDEDVQAVMY